MLKRRGLPAPATCVRARCAVGFAVALFALPLHAKLPFQNDNALDPNPNAGWNGTGGQQGP